MNPILYGDILSASVDNKVYAEMADHAKVCYEITLVLWPISIGPGDTIYALFVCAEKLLIWAITFEWFIIFHMCIPLCKTLSLVSRSRLSVKVKVRYQGQIFKKNIHYKGITVSQTQLVSLFSVWK